MDLRKFGQVVKLVKRRNKPRLFIFYHRNDLAMNCQSNIYSFMVPGTFGDARHWGMCAFEMLVSFLHGDNFK